ncbi:UNVERIFIED_CONTAM: hypothetical protein K2H54_024140 [Gekko kuhli]
MWTRWYVAICLLELGGSNAEILQQPNLVLQEGQDAHFKCRQTNNHDYMYWYWQKAGQGPEFFYYFLRKEEQLKGDVPERFVAKQPQEYHLILNISAVKREDSAVYLCATSQDTALQSPCHFLQKPASIIT